MSCDKRMPRYAYRRTRSPYQTGFLKLMALLVVALDVRGQENSRPYTSEDVVALIRGQVPPLRVLALSRQHDVSFDINPQISDEIKVAGGTEELVRTLS